jgi:tetratricopeptide (TPR) repeat protein
MCPRSTTIGICLAVFTCLLFADVWRFESINLDDPAYFTANPHVQSGLTPQGVIWAFTTGHAGNWHPLTWLSHMLDAQLFGPGPRGPHAVNLLLHVANTILVFLILRRMTGFVWRSAIVAALFAWHPLRVESVAWLAERKDVLSSFFFLLTIWAYAAYSTLSKVHPQTTLQCPPAQKPQLENVQRASGSTTASAAQPNRRRTWSYILALLLFALGLMSKPMAVTLPFTLLLLDFWPLRRLTHEPGNFALLVREKLPFFFLSFISCIVTFRVQQHSGAVQSMLDCPLAIRLENVFISYIRYLGKTFWPINLPTPYPPPQASSPLAVALSALVLALLTISALMLARRHPPLAVGWLWFIGMLVPVIGVVQVGAQSMANRYTYLPSIGLFIALVWPIAEIAARARFRPVWTGIAAASVLFALFSLTRLQLSFWKNTETLLSHAITITTNNWLAHFNLAFEFDRQGRTDEALEQYRRALAVHPLDPDTLNNIGCDLAKKKEYAEAVPSFEAALQLKPGFADAHYNLARCLLQLGRSREAIPHYEIFLRNNPDHETALREIGVALAMIGNLNEAIANLEKAIRLRPDDAQAHFNLGEALALQGKSTEARVQLSEALRLKPDWAEAKSQLQALESEAPH